MYLITSVCVCLSVCDHFLSQDISTRNSSGDETPERDTGVRYLPSIGPPPLYFATPLAFNAPDGGVPLEWSP